VLFSHAFTNAEFPYGTAETRERAVGDP